MTQNKISHLERILLLPLQSNLVAFDAFVDLAQSLEFGAYVGQLRAAFGLVGRHAILKVKQKVNKG